MDRKAELVLIRGLPGSGKSSMARMFESMGFEHCEADKFFSKNGKYEFDPAKLTDAHAWCLAEAASKLEAGLPVVVSNTFTRQWELQPYLELAERLGAPLFVVEARGKFGNVHGVDGSHVERMRARWEPLGAPPA